MSDERELQPGEYDAVMRGCVCTVRDGEPQDNERWPDWLVRGCPLHDLDMDRENPASIQADRRRPGR